jgi:hypothetical protein
MSRPRRTVADRTEREELLTRVMRGEICEIVARPDGTPIEIPPKVRDRVRACELLGKAQGDFTNPTDLEAEIRRQFAVFKEKMPLDAFRELLKVLATGPYEGPAQEEALPPPFDPDDHEEIEKIEQRLRETSGKC